MKSKVVVLIRNAGIKEFESILEQIKSGIDLDLLVINLPSPDIEWEIVELPNTEENNITVINNSYTNE